ncbi:MAG: 2-dehydropantoate 2-reductase [Bdellovibrionota bacterium]
MRNYAIIGTGAIGGACAVKLYQAGFKVHCLLRSDYLYVQKYGLTLISGEEKFTAPIMSYQNVQDMPVCDIILVTFKTTENRLLKNILPKIMHSETVVVLLQNGIGMEDELAEFIDPSKIIGGSISLIVNKETQGVIRHSGLNSVEFSKYQHEQKKDNHKYIEILEKDFKKSGFNATAEGHLPTIRWKKLTANIPISGLSVVLNASNQDLVCNCSSFQLLCDLTKEVIEAAKASGAEISEEFYQHRINVLESFKFLVKSYPSMKKDFDNKRPLELHAIYENPILIAEKNKALMPLTNMLYQQLQYLC